MARSLIMLLGFVGAGYLFGQDQTAAKLTQFVYVLRLVPRLHDEHAWTKQDNAAAEQHFNRLKDATDRGQVILASRTAESLDKTFGLVVFDAKDQDAALEFMIGDPGACRVMTAELHPFSVALARRNLE